MWDTPSPSEATTPRTRAWGAAVDIAFACITVVLLYATLVMQGYETVPYHILFVTFAAVYGFRVWSLPITVGVLGAIVVGTGIIFYEHWRNDELPGDELFEIVLMPAILGAMVWHARRRFAAQRQVEHLAARERERRLHEHELARDTSHALRTPLTIARGHVDLIRESSDDEQVRRDAEVALQELDRIGRMASRLLAIAELERPDALTPRPMDLAALVREVHERWSVSVTRKWSVEAPESLPVLVDDDVIRVVLDALVENAVAMTQPRDEVRLVCRRFRDSVLLGVADSGPGISPDDASLVFQRFWRSPDKREGTGLGLSYVRAAAEAHAGTVVVAKSSLGGALVGCRLPLDVESVLPAPQVAQVGSGAASA
jgi:two-component system, OmpR family, sensor kinase